MKQGFKFRSVSRGVTWLTIGLGTHRPDVLFDEFGRVGMMTGVPPNVLAVGLQRQNGPATHRARTGTLTGVAVGLSNTH